MGQVGYQPIDRLNLIKTFWCDTILLKWEQDGIANEVKDGGHVMDVFLLSGDRCQRIKRIAEYTGVEEYYTRWIYDGKIKRRGYCTAL